MDLLEKNSHYWVTSTMQQSFNQIKPKSYTSLKKVKQWKKNHIHSMHSIHDNLRIPSFPIGNLKHFEYFFEIFWQNII